MGLSLLQTRLTESFRFLTDAGEVHMDRVQLILDGLGKVEDSIFKRRQEREEAWKAKNARFNDGNRGRPAARPAYVPDRGLLAPTAKATHLSGSETRDLAADARVQVGILSKTFS